MGSRTALVEDLMECFPHVPREAITPRFTTWCPESTTPLGKANPLGAPLEYHIRLLEAYRATMDDFGLSSPPGYGPPGYGPPGYGPSGYGPSGPRRPVFSVISFMDSLPAEESATV